MNMSIKQVLADAHQGYLESIDLKKSFEGLRRKSEKMAKTFVESCKKKKSSKK